MTPTVVIAESLEPLRRGVRLALQRGGFRIVGEASDARSAVDAAVRLQPDICLLDVRIPGGGITAATAISARTPETKIVMLTLERDDASLFAALQAGASGYLLKETHPDRLVRALKGALNGEAAIPRSLVTRLIAEFRKREARDLRRRALESRAETSLTNREWDVLRHLEDGRTTAEIADLLGVTPVTVRTHVASLLAKLRVPDRDGAVRRLREVPEF